MQNYEVPAKVYVEKIADGIEKAEPRAELLTEVVNKLEGDTDLMQTIWDRAGTPRSVRTYPTVAVPRDPEELRNRIAILGIAWAFVAILQPSSKVLAGCTPQDWTSHLENVLGPFVHRLHARDQSGNIVASPPWTLVSSYEQEIRRKMVELMTDGIPIAEALKKAREDSVVKKRYFTTPLSAGSRKRKAEEYPNTENYDFGSAEYNHKGKGKTKGKGKGKTKSKGKYTAPVRTCEEKAPDNKKICFKFNDRDDKCTRKKCPFLHVCGWCSKDHPIYRCTN